MKPVIALMTSLLCLCVHATPQAPMTYPDVDRYFYHLYGDSIDKDELIKIPMMTCLNTTSLAMIAGDYRQSGTPFETAKNEMIDIHVNDFNDQKTQDFYRALIIEYLELAYREPIVSDDEKQGAIIKLRTKELARCGKAFGDEDIGRYYVHFENFTDLREKYGYMMKD